MSRLSMLIGLMLSVLYCQSQPPDDSVFVRVDISDQSLELIVDGRVEKTWPVSTSKYGIGNRAGSNKTPLGRHIISRKFGDDAPFGMIFKARKSTGQIAPIHADSVDVPEDFITTRILRLKGLEPGVNQGRGIDSYDRFIYIHGTPEEGLIGRPASHGCIRMKNEDVIELFDMASEGTFVQIIE